MTTDARQISDNVLTTLVSVLAGGFLLLGSVTSVLTGLLALYSLYLWFARRLTPLSGKSMNGVIAVISIYIGAGFLAAIIHYDDRGSLDQALMRLAYLWFVPLASIVALLPPARLYKAVVTGAAVGAICAAAYAGFELYALNTRAWGGAGNPGPFATIAAVQFGVVLTALWHPGTIAKPFLWLGAIAAAWCVYASGMRTLFPVLIIAPIVLIMLAAASRNGVGSTEPRRPERLTMFALVLLLALSLAFVGTHDRIWAIPQELNAILQNGASDTSLGHRVAMLSYAQDRLPEVWPFGLGSSETMAGLREYTIANFGFALTKTHLHNIFLSAYIRGGIIDLIGVAVFIFAMPLIVLANWIRTRAFIPAALMLSLWTPYFLSSQLNLAFAHDVLDHFYVFSLAVVFAMVKVNRIPYGREMEPERPK